MNDQAIITGAIDATVAELENKFTKKKHRKIAKKCLTLCEEWAIMKGAENIYALEKAKAKKSLRAYVKNGFQKEDVVGGLFLTIILGIVIKMIIEWIIEKFIVNLRKA